MNTSINAIIMEVQDQPRAAPVRMGAVAIEVTDRPLKQALRFSAGIIEEAEQFPNKVILAK
ncbi:MAG TPA: hypothetical protein VD772_05640 [Anseongella sp.]|nr:hypothetical protein [Anseongella sp.]